MTTWKDKHIVAVLSFLDMLIVEVFVLSLKSLRLLKPLNTSKEIS